MPRQHRVRSRTDVYHVNSKALEHLHPFAAAGDRWQFVRSLGELVARRGWIVHGYCVLETHFHVVVRAEPNVVSRGMQWLKGRHGWTFNRRNGRSGPVFAERFHAEPVENDGHAFEAVAYVDLNPVRAGLCVHPRDWPWSSYRAHAGLEPGPPWLAPLDDFFGVFDSPRMSVSDCYAAAVDSVLARQGGRRFAVPDR